MGKKKRRMTSPKYAKKFAAKFAKYKQALKDIVTPTEVKEEVIKEAPKATVKEVDESAISEPKPKKRSRRISPRKKTSDSKKKPAKKKTSKRKTSKKD